MLHKYRKTALIEAEQFDGSIKQITRYKVHIVGPTSRGNASYFLLPTKEGNMKLNAGDYIATGIDGEHWAIDKDVFKRTYERRTTMKTKLFLMSATLLAALSLTGVASADTTRDQIEAEGNQQIQAYWNEYQQALQEREDAWNQGQGNRFTPAYITADAKAGATYQEWLRAQTQLGDDLHNYDVDQWQKEEDQQQVDQISQQQQPQHDQQVTTTQASQISQQQPQTEVTKTNQPQTKASVTQPNQQANVEAKSTTHSSQQATTSRASAKPANLSSQVKKPAQSTTVQNDQQTKLPQTGNDNLLTAVGTLLFAFWGVLIGVWKFFDARRGGKR